MLRRCASEFSFSRKLHLLIPLSSKTYFIPRSSPFSSAASPNPNPPRSSLPRFLLLGGVAVLGAAALAAREAGYVDVASPPSGSEAAIPDPPPPSDLRGGDDEIKVNVDRAPVETASNSQEDLPQVEIAPPEVSSGGEDVVPVALQDGVSREETDVKMESKVTEPPPEESTTEEQVRDDAATEHVISHESVLQVNNDSETSEPESLANSYLLVEEECPQAPSIEEAPATTFDPSSSQEVPVTDGEVSRDELGDDKIVIDLIQAIHAAEKRQAESDFRVFEEEKREIKEKYEEKLKDTRGRELMYAEKAALLEKELNKEKVNAEATVKNLQEKAEQKLKSEMQKKEEEAEMQLKKAQELAKAELNAAVASEKSTQMEKMTEANYHIDALCMAFYARSEETRQNHSVYKLALGVLALEEASSNGFPIQQEVEDLRASLVDIKTDPLMELVLSSLPEETINHGTDTKLQLNQKFDDLKSRLRHFSIIPPGGGGILTHAVARIASIVKVKESNMSGDGIESIIRRVERLLAEEKLAEAAHALEQGVSGTEAEGAIGEWVRQAKNRAIVDQAVALIRSYATSVSLT